MTKVFRAIIIRECERSLKRLKRDHIDIYFIHEWDGTTPVQEKLAALDTLMQQGKIRYIGCSNYSGWHIMKSLHVAEIKTTYQVTPLKVGNRLLMCTPHNWAIALDATTGKEIWKYDPNVGMNPDRQHQTCRGVTYYRSTTVTSGPCAERVYLPTSDARLIALDAASGTVCESFADKGMLKLDSGMLHDPAGYYYSTSPPVIASGKIIIGGAVNDNYSTTEQSGVIRAFDVETGALIWNWDSGNPTDTQPLAAGQHYVTNSPNSWSVFSVDETLGLVYIPLGNQVPDQMPFASCHFSVVDAGALAVVRGEVSPICRSNPEWVTIATCRAAQNLTIKMSKSALGSTAYEIYRL